MEIVILLFSILTIFLITRKQKQVLELENAIIACAKLSTRIDAINRKLDNKIKHIKNITQHNQNSMIGTKVIARSNENDPLHIGKLIGFEFITKSKIPCPIIQVGETQLLTMGIVIPYNKDFLNTVKHMTPKQQWDYMINKKLGLKWK